MRHLLPCLLLCASLARAEAPGEAARAQGTPAPLTDKAPLPSQTSASRAPLPGGAFVRVEGTRFFVRNPASGKDRPFFFVGANFNPLHGELARARYREIIAALAHDGMTVGRIWALGEGPQDASEWARSYELFRAGPTGFVEGSYVQLDRVLAEARAQGVRLIITLSNHWKDYGGLPMYLTWAGLDARGLGFEAFYDNEQVRGFFRDGLEKLLSRTNTVTGVRYIDDPTIFAWELMNESSVLSAAGAAARRTWIVQMARFIKERDKNHLVAPGLLGYDMRAERAEWVRVHKMPEVDYCDAHLYPQLAGSVTSWQRVRDFIDDRAQLARFVIGKPLVIGEFGFRTDDKQGWLGWPRGRWFDAFVQQVLRDGAAGALVWIYQPYAGRPQDFGIYTDEESTSDVRAVLSSWAHKLDPRPSPGPDPGTGSLLPANPRLSASRGDAPLYQPFVHLFGKAPVHRAWRRGPGGLVLPIQPEDFAEARFERTGVWKGGVLAHVYGADTGRFRYRFAAPPRSHPAAIQPLRAIQIAARMSSEWPGDSAPPDGGSLVRLLIDGAQVAKVQVIADDGLGKMEVVTLSAPLLLRRLSAGNHTLTFEVPDLPGAHGLCIYGEATGKAPPPQAIPIQPQGPLAPAPDPHQDRGPEGPIGPIQIRYLTARP